MMLAFVHFCSFQGHSIQFTFSSEWAALVLFAFEWQPNQQQVAEFALGCQTYEGGFGGEPGAEAHGG